MNFKQLQIQPAILKALAEQGYQEPSPIQEKAIPAVLQGRDIIGCAQTGTGKTCAFAVPIIQRLGASQKVYGKNRPIRALVLTPTRELALQIFGSFRSYAKHTRVRSCVVFGGVSQQPQVEALQRGVDVLIATPGRLNDLIAQGYVHLSGIEIFVLDEADRMLDMGFIHDVQQVVRQLPCQRQTLLFSATMPKEIVSLAHSILCNPIKIVVAPSAAPVELIQQSVYFVDQKNKTPLLIFLIKNLSVGSALVFTRTKSGADRVARELHQVGIKAQSLHGDKSQRERQQALRNFKNKQIQVLVATDIAARGIDVDNLSHVFNYHLPDMPETYVHRIGRTGRAGRGGIAIAFCDANEKPLLEQIEKTTRRKVLVVKEHPYPMTAPLQQGQRKSNRAARVNAKYKGNSLRSSAGRTPSDGKSSKSYLYPQASMKKFKSVDEWIEHNPPANSPSRNEIFDFARRSLQPRSNHAPIPRRSTSKRRQG